ncbi:MAG: 3-oxoacyl-ACP reductase FabG [Moorea sp. SIO1G6]|uniref:SDR family NAD(P)-dependent oxidoreductase n=1 Tax=unclassified Moorena TaxID=2683338 RepID=UPI0013B7B747|nr:MULTISPECIES: 3-oxoacyl-ACP reductase family protein [unclassified Moorena]NEQ10290.1 3-oxoacyl-ACP reductase FabG [Moorena sp. SIO4E2]NEQ13529.1 3-oxoacyl-ACP reductase FabG [Moorena sp. SIO3E2]NES84609.1 3-oxoacyl-ACP reductase FabG [Moorena sp. SIO2B7]NET69371.1 3-oxoacyl-ACP reductase FabG [Moorena sp. SIO1G6]
MEINKKTALVTGGGKGIGSAISKKLASLGYNVAVNYLSDTQSAEATVADIKALSGTAMLVRADISNSQEVESMVQQVDAAYGGVDVLINNAGMNIDKPFLEMTEEEWDRVIDTNLKGAFLVSRAVARLMKAKHLQGNIINIGATTAISGRKNGVNYCSSKAGLLVMTRCLAKELAPDIRVNSVIPGFTRTRETIERFQLDTQEDYELSKRNIPLNRLGKPDEVAVLVAFIISEEAAYINGQKFIIDGGEYMI